MRAIQVSSFGAPEVLRLAELPDAAPGPGEVAINVTHAAVGLIARWPLTGDGGARRPASQLARRAAGPGGLLQHPGPGSR